ncbi:MAG: hypothetical protein R3271_11695 [Methylophaga sp.]|uniref:hypothetical protein n=1 Tax=Methylophaga sp. TaxID=2024840 RepID=UPI002727788C|nr:hypothetical protein [Methylophaga sp.]MDO8827963.1 hypothetical protein [Methylophaga sp.]MDX1750973.1 hypothetical protein [Methylophaga sp.]
MFRFTLFSIAIIFANASVADERSDDSSPWKAYKQEDSFTGNKWCYVRTSYMKDSEGNYMRDIILPTNQRAMNKRGEFIDLNYNISLGLMGTMKKGVQANLDGVLVDMDNNIESVIETLSTGEQLKIRFEWKSQYLGTVQETHTIKLDTFSDAWAEATAMCN